MPDNNSELEAELGVTEPEPDITEPEVKEEPKEKPLTAADIAAAVASAIAPQRVMTAEQQEQEWLRLEAESGQSRQQLIYNDNARRQANLRENLPHYEENGRNRAEKTLGGDKDLLAKVQEMMAKHPDNVRANPQAWEDAAFLIKGKFGGANKSEKKDAADPGKVVGGAGGKLNPGLSEKGGAGGKPAGGGKKKEYSEFEQRIIDTTCHGSAEEYEKYKDRNSTKPRAVTVEGANRADLALQGLTRGVKV